MIEIPVLQATPAFGLHENPMGKAAYRFCIQNLVNEQVWTGFGFTPDWTKALLYASANEACKDMRKIMMSFYDSAPVTVYEAPVRIEVFGEADMLRVAQWLSKASVLKLRTDDYGNGPDGSLVLPVIHWAEMEKVSHE